MLSPLLTQSRIVLPGPGYLGATADRSRYFLVTWLVWNSYVFIRHTPPFTL